MKISPTSFIIFIILPINGGTIWNSIAQHYKKGYKYELRVF